MHGDMCSFRESQRAGERGETCGFEDIPPYRLGDQSHMHVCLANEFRQVVLHHASLLTVPLLP